MSTAGLATVAKRSLQAGSLGGLSYGTYLYQTDEGTRRMCQAYASFVPVALHYRWLEAQQKWLPEGSVTDEDWHALDVKYAKTTIDQLGKLNGMYTKYGQTAAGLTNTFSPLWIKYFRTLENQVPPRPVEVVLETIQQELGCPPDHVFSEIDPVPLGSASIGQVHRAVLKETGQVVAIKVQYPEARHVFQSDMYSIRRFCEWLAPENVVTLSALEKQNALELDYLQEAANLKLIHANMKRDGFLPREVVVPLPLEKYTTQRLLTMEYLPGVKLLDGVRSYFREWALQHGTTLEQLEKEARHRIETEGIPAKYQGPSARQMGFYRSWVRTKDVVVNTGVFLHNWTLGLVRRKSWDYVHTTIPPNIPRIVDTLMRVHAYQLLKDGVFNADPHGGNFLLLPDGRIGLIDYGATKTMTREERLSSCLLYAALARNDEDFMWEMCQISGYKSKYNRRDVLMKLIRFGYDSWGRDVLEGKNVQQFIDDMKTQDPWEKVPDNFVMSQFMSVRLRSLALGMNHPVKCSEWMGPIAEQVLNEEGLPYESWDRGQLLKYRPKMNYQEFRFA